MHTLNLKNDFFMLSWSSLKSKIVFQFKDKKLRAFFNEIVINCVLYSAVAINRSETFAETLLHKINIHKYFKIKSIHKYVQYIAT